MVCDDPEHLKRMVRRLFEIALDRVVSDDELPDYITCAHLLDTFAVLAEKAKIILAGRGVQTSR